MHDILHLGRFEDDCVAVTTSDGNVTVMFRRSVNAGLLASVQSAITTAGGTIVATPTGEGAAYLGQPIPPVLIVSGLTPAAARDAARTGWLNWQK